MTREEMLKIKEERGYSFARLSQYSGVPLGTIQKVLTGVTKKPRKATLDAIEKVLSGQESLYSGKAYHYEEHGNNFGLLKESSPDYGPLNEERKGIGHTVSKEPGSYTIDDYRSLPEERRAELIDGVFYDMTAPFTIHQRIISMFFSMIAAYIRDRQGQCMVFFSPLDVQLDCDDKTVLQPDLVIVCDQAKIRKSGIYGAPDFVLEVLSQSTRKKDMTKKLQKYADAGVKEYWMVDPEMKKAIIYNFMEENLMPRILPLSGTCGLALYEQELQIDLGQIADEIEKFEKIYESE